MSMQNEYAFLAKLAAKLKEHNSWCGETHMQKATYLCKVLGASPISAKYILYKFGPFSFDLRDMLTDMRAREILKLTPQGEWGASFSKGETFNSFLNKFDQTNKDYESTISKIANFVGNRKVAELERLSTAVFVNEELGKDCEIDEKIRKFNSYKPHIESAKAIEAFQAVEELYN